MAFLLGRSLTLVKGEISGGWVALLSHQDLSFLIKSENANESVNNPGSFWRGVEFDIKLAISIGCRCRLEGFEVWAVP